jgi:hypothetical protein
MATGLAVLAGGAAFAFKQFEDSENVLQQTDAVLKSTGNSAHVTASHVAELADALSKKAGVDDEAIQAGENMLLTFKNIRNEVGKGNDIFDQASKTTLDLAAGMAAASGGEVDLKAASIQLGKALNDPVAGMTALTRVGVQFTEEQQKQIAQFVKHNNLLGAQKLILGEVTSQFAGSAEAQKTASGSMRVAFENLAESIGGVLAPVIQKLVGWLTTLADWFTSLPKGMQTFITSAVAVAAVTILAVKAFGLAHTAISALSAILSVNPYVLIIAATIAIAILIVKNWDTIKAFLIKVWDAIVDAAKFFWDHIAIFIIGPMKLVIDFLIDHWRGFKDVFLAIWDAIREGVGRIVGPVIAIIKTIVSAIQGLIGWIQNAIEWLGKLEIGSSKVSLAPGGPRRAGGLDTAQHGGEVLSTGLALVHKGEVFSGVNNEMGFGGGLTVIINGDVTGEEVVRKVRDGLLKLKARNATTGL